MDIVALLSLGTPVEVEAPLLAADLGSTTYETALLLRAPSPIPILRTDDRARALALLGRLRSRGHDAVACDASAVVSASSMLHVRAFALEPDALVVRTEAGATDRVPWGDFVAFVRAIHTPAASRSRRTRPRNSTSAARRFRAGSWSRRR